MITWQLTIIIIVGMLCITLTINEIIHKLLK